jgi:WD40 repeat protein
MLTYDGKRAVTLTEGGYLFLWDVAAVRPISAMKLELRPRESPTLAQPVLSPRGLFLATNPSSSTIACYDLSAMSPTPVTTTIADEITVMQFDPSNDAQLAVAGTLGISLLDAPTLLANDFLPSNTLTYTSIAWNPTGSAIAVIEDEQFFRIIDLVSGMRTARYGALGAGELKSLAWTSDASKLYLTGILPRRPPRSLGFAAR